MYLYLCNGKERFGGVQNGVMGGGWWVCVGAKMLKLVLGGKNGTRGWMVDVNMSNRNEW